MTPIPLHISRALRQPPARGWRRGRPGVPANMRSRMAADEAAAWEHSRAAGILWESGERLARAKAWAEIIAGTKNNCCTDAESVLLSSRRQDAAPAPGETETHTKMKLHIYTNNAYDTVALVNEDGKIVSHWDANAKGGVQKTALEDALYTDDVSEWDDQGHEIAAEEFGEGNDLFLVIHDDGEWEVEDRKLLADRLRFHLGPRHPIVQAIFA